MPSAIAYDFSCVIVWPSYFSDFWASYDLPSVRDARWRGHWEKLSPCKQLIGDGSWERGGAVSAGPLQVISGLVRLVQDPNPPLL